MSSADSKKPRIPLAVKGLIALAIPVIIQAGFLAGFGQILNTSEGIIQGDYRAKSLIGRVNWIAALTATSGLSALEYAITQNQECKIVHDNCVRKLENEFAQLATTVQSDRLQLEAVHRARVLAPNLDQLNNDLMRSKDADTTVRVQEPRTLSLWEALYNLRGTVLQAENARFSFGENSFREVREQRRNWLAAGMVMNLLLAVALFFIFFRQIASRVDRVAANTALFKEGKPLLDPISGNDEVASLDRSFHDMCSALKEAEEHKRQYLAMLNHDLRSPLTSISGTLYLLKSGIGASLDEDGAATIERGEANVDRMLRLIDQFLEVEHLGSGAIPLAVTQVSLRALLERSAQSVETTARQRNISVSLDAADAQIKVDPDALSRVVVNLLSNAIKYSPDDSTISLRAIQSDSAFTVEVKDSGRGVPADMQEKIFERFQQVEKTDRTEKGGFGLGLAICKAIVAAHGGTIGVRSAAGDGSTFWFTIPQDAPVTAMKSI